MQPSSPETFATVTLFDRVFEWSLGATLLGSSTILAIGSAPLWVEYAAAGVLWSIVVLFLSLMAAASWSINTEPLPDYLKHHRERGVPLIVPGGWTGYFVSRLIFLLIVVLLVAAGRPVVAILYVILLAAGIALFVANNRWVYGFTRSQVSTLDWVVYQAFRVPWFAIRRLFS